MRMRIAAVAAVAGLGVVGSARAQAASGQLELSGTSTVGSWRCRESTIHMASASPDDVAGRPAVEDPASGGMALRFPVRDIDCGDALMNNKLRHALKSDRHPAISFALTPSQLRRAAQAPEVPLAVEGTLSIAGRSEAVRTQITVTPVAGDALRVKGEQSLRMSAFGVKPPRLFFGALKVRDRVHVGFDIVLRGHAAALLAQRAPG